MAEFIYFPQSESEKLIYSGCYYFKLQFDPNYQIKANELLNNFTIGKTNETIQNDKLMVDRLVKSFTDALKTDVGNSATAFVENAVQRADIAALYGKYKAATGIQTLNILEQATNDNSAGREYNYEALYEMKSLENNTNHIFLPLNSMKISRRAGITSQQGVYGSVQAQASAKAIKQSEEAFEGTLSTITKSSGLSDNPFLGHSISGVDFERFSMEWDLQPKNQQDMENILKIALYFQTSCLSNLNINDKKTAKWILPPRSEVGILVSNLSTLENTEMQKMIEERNFQQKDTPRIDEAYDNIKTFWLKPPISVFVDSVTIEPLENKGGVLLSPEGFPMGIKLSIELIRTSLSTVEDLFRTNNSDMMKKGENYKKGNPFA